MLNLLVCTTAEAEVNSSRSPEPREQLVVLGYLDTALTQKLFPRGKRIQPSGLGVWLSMLRSLTESSVLEHSGI